MPIKATHLIEGHTFYMYKKSIKVDKLGTTFFYNREVTEVDAERLAELIVLGKQDKQEEMKKVFTIT